MDGDKLIVEITEGEELSSIQMIHSDGTKEFKTISFYDFMETMKQEAPITTGLLPPGTRMFSGDEHTFKIIIEQPAQKYRMSFNNLEISKRDMPIPTTLFSIGVANNRLNHSQIVCIQPPLLDESREIFFFPYGNADTNICWGSAMPKKITGVKGIYSIIARFMDSHFNGDLATFRGFERFADMIDAVRDLDEYPHKYLTSTGMTFSEFKRSLFYERR